MELDVFARGEVSLLEWCVFLGDFPKHLQLSRRQTAERGFDAYHLAFGLTLPVNPLTESKSHERGLFEIAVSEPLFLLLEVGDLLTVDMQYAGSRDIGLPVGLFFGCDRGHFVNALRYACAAARGAPISGNHTPRAQSGNILWSGGYLE